MIRYFVKNDSSLSAMVKKAFFIVLAVLMYYDYGIAQNEGSKQPMLLFQSDEILNLDLEADFKAVSDLPDDSTYFPARFSLSDNDGLERTIDIRIRTRGKTRRDKDICKFAPLRLNFPKKEMDNTPFEGQNAIKLVTHCNNADFYEQQIIIEYLIYKTFNILTDSSFKVRAAFINYVDTEKKEDTLRKFAFFIEREKHLADRLQGIELESDKIHPNRQEPYHTCLLDMFQYMIGNTDYSAYEKHNIILISDSARQHPAIAIPYDFDWSGLVSAVYAVPHPLMNTERVTERVYRGFPKDPEIIDHTVSRFNARKEEIYQLFENFELLDKKEKKEAINYLDTFYWIINNDKRVKDVFIENAREVHK